MITFSLHQATEIVTGSTYQVTNRVVMAEGASSAVYVYKTLTQEFSHYAAAVDMERYPDTYEVATVTAAPFYRLPVVVRTWDTVAMMDQDLTVSLRRLQYLADELNTYQGALVIDRTTVVRSV